MGDKPPPYERTASNQTNRSLKIPLPNINNIRNRWALGVDVKRHNDSLISPGIVMPAKWSSKGVGLDPIRNFVRIQDAFDPFNFTRVEVSYQFFEKRDKHKNS